MRCAGDVEDANMLVSLSVWALLLQTSVLVLQMSSQDAKKGVKGNLLALEL